MTRRQFSFAPLAVSVSTLTEAALAEETSISLRGKLVTQGDHAGSLTLPDGKSMKLTGDEQTRGVVNDARLNGVDFEVVGNASQSGAFEIQPIHKRAMFVHHKGKKLFVTYWCAVCAIRTYAPGICWCCQDETVLDLRETMEISNS